MDSIGVNRNIESGVTLSAQNVREKFILFLLTFQLLLPGLCLVIYIYLGIFLNPFSAYFLISIAILLFTFFCISRKASLAVYLHFICFLMLQLVTITGHVAALGVGNGIVEGLRTISNFYFCWYLGYAGYFTFYRSGRMEVLLKWIVRAGIFIAVVNIIHFFFNTIVGNYGAVRSYLEILNQNLADYLDIEGSNGFLRHAGYFMDTHSQFYIPLAALIILQVEDIKLKGKGWCITLIVVSILLSGVKTAYLIMLIMWLIILLRSNTRAVLNFLAVLLIVAAAVLIYFNETVINMAIMIFTHDMDILVEHIYYNPVKLYNNYPLVFLIGGSPGLVEKLYSEVYLVTLMYYIGLVGLLFYLSPFVVFFFNRNRKYYLGLILLIYLVLTLSHYPVYKVGVNNIVSALPVVYFLAAINNFKLKNGK